MKILDKTTQTYKELVLKPGGDTVPIGSIVAFASDTIPNGWLLCDGSVVSRATYSELFNAIGLNYVEDGVEWLDEERFPLPNAKGRTLVGKDSTDTDFNKLGKTVGEKTHRHNFTIGQLYSYGVPVGDGFDNVGAYKDSTSTFAGTTGTINAKITNKNTGVASSMDTGVQAGGKTSTGDTTLGGNLQPSLTLNYIIKAKNTVVVKGDVIQETDTASENNTYSAKAIDNKLKTNITTGQEVATNESIDGKTVYCTRISINAYPGDNVTLNHNINNIDEIIDYDAIFTLSSGETRKMPGIWKTDYSSFMSTVYQVTKKTMQIVLGSFWTSGTFKKAVITIKYTKNT